VWLEGLSKLKKKKKKKRNDIETRTRDVSACSAALERNLEANNINGIFEGSCKHKLRSGGAE
jgi:hypothetical protein